MSVDPSDLRFSLEVAPPDSPVTIRNMLFTARLSGMAYQLAEHSGKPYADGMLSHFEFGVTRGLIFDSPTVLVIAFTGSQTRADWLSNLDIRVAETKIGAVHHGFLRSLIDIGEKGLPYLWALSAIDKPIVICGHSRGGALAMLMAAILHDRGTRVHAVYTFCSPKVGGRSWIDYWQATGIPLYPVINGNDPVPRLPPSSIRELLWFLFYVIPLNVVLIGGRALIRKLTAGKSSRGQG